MKEHDPGTDENADAAQIERTVSRLAGERGELFDRASARFGLSKEDTERLHSIERELDECFLARRRIRAARDAKRFDPYTRMVRTAPEREVLS